MHAPSPESLPLKKSLGQHFLNNPRIAAHMVEAATVTPDDVVLEIGAGSGFLTREILKTGATVTAIETDPRMIARLTNDFQKEVKTGQLTLLAQDIRQTDPANLKLVEHTYKVVANIPYFLSGFLFRFFLTASVQPKTLVFLVQKEIAERIARDKKSSLLSLSVRAYGTPEYIETVGRGSFRPPPKVSSAILKVGNISRDNFTHIDESLFFSVLHLGFAAKRKQLLGNLAKQYDRTALVHIFSTLEIPLDVRGEDLPLKTWLKLSSALSVHNS